MFPAGSWGIFPKTCVSRGTHDDPIGNVWANAFERNPLRRETAYEQMQIEVYDYWYKVATEPGKAPLVYNAIYVGNTLVKNEAHPEYGGKIPYIHLPNGKIPGSPYGKPALYDPEQLLPIVPGVRDVLRSDATTIDASLLNNSATPS